MLHYETIDPLTLGLLEKLQQTDAFSKLRLAEGTSLALQIGHRKSIDIDLFGVIEVDEYTMSSELSALGNVTTLKKSENITIVLINGVKVDLVNYPYPWIDRMLEENKITLAGLKDIAAMKLAAITGRGTKKDFIDIYFLLQKYSLTEMMAFYKQKYQDGSEFLVLKSLSYFEDANNDEEPIMLIETDWEKVKKFIGKELEI